MKTLKRALFLLLAVVMLAGSLAACGGKSMLDVVQNAQNEAAGGEWDGTPQHGGHLNVRSTARPTGIDPLKQTGAWKYQWTTCVYEPFMTRDPNNKIEACVCNFVMKDYTDENGQLHNELWIWPREGYTFSKGYGQVDMNDIVASFNRGLTQYANIKKYVKPNINAETNKVYKVSELDAEIQEMIKTTAAEDTAGGGKQNVTEVFHIDFKYHEKNLYYLAAWRTWWPVMPAEICEKYATSYIINQLEDGVGTGPYEFSEFKDSTFVTIKKREGFTPVEQHADNIGMSKTKIGYMDTMTFWYNGTDASAASAVLAGQYDLTEVIPSEYAAQAEAANITLSKLHSDQRTWIYFNTMGTNNVVAKYPSLRKAVMAAIDYDSYLEFVTDDSQIMDTDQLMLGGEKGIYNFVTAKFKAADYYGDYNQDVVDKYMAMAKEEGYKGEPLQIPHHTGRTDIPTITAATMDRAGINYELVPNENSVHNAFIGDPSNNWDFYYSWGVTYHTPGTMADSLVKNNFKSDRVLEIRETLMPTLDCTSQEYLDLWDEWTDIWVEECQIGYLSAIDWWWWHPEDLVVNDGGDDPNDMCEQRYFYNTYWKHPTLHPKK